MPGFPEESEGEPKEPFHAPPARAAHLNSDVDSLHRTTPTDFVVKWQNVRLYGQNACPARGWILGRDWIII
jgi:hypothetical protein